MRWDRVRLRLHHRLQFFIRLLIPSMLARRHRIRELLIRRNPVLRIRQIPAADRRIVTSSPPPENAAYPNDFNRSISAGSSPVFSASSLPALYSRIIAASFARIASATAFFSPSRLCVSPGSFDQIVQLWLRRVDEVILRIFRAAQFAPVEMNPRKIRLSVQAAIPLSPSSQHCCRHLRQQALPLHLRRNLHSHRFSTVGIRSTSDTGSATIRPPGLPGTRIISGTCMVAL